MATRRADVDVLGMPWDELVRRVAAVAATGNQRARAELRWLVDEEDRAREEGREPGDVFARLATLAVLEPIHEPPMGHRDSASSQRGEGNGDFANHSAGSLENLDRPPGAKERTMADLSLEVREMLETLKSLEVEQRERYQPKPPEPETPAEAFVKRLNAARSRSISVDAGWLR